MKNFQLVGLEPGQFEPLFTLPDDQLAARHIIRTRASTSPGYPCRVSLEDAAVGEEVLLLPFAHHRANSPYQSLGPIYVRRDARQRILEPGVVPDYVTRRLISIRVYNGEHMMTEAHVEPGDRVADRLAEIFDGVSTAYVHLHNAKQGCFSCLVRRS